MKNNNQKLISEILTILSLSTLLGGGCQTPPAPPSSSEAPELEVPDVSIPWQKSGKISSSLMEVQISSQSKALRHEALEFQKTYIEYPLRQNLKTLILSVEFSGPHPDIWQNWNQQIFNVVEKIKNELRRDPSLELQLEKFNSMKRPQANATPLGLREVPFNRVEIEYLSEGYDLIFRSEIPGLFEHRLRLEVPKS